MISMKKIFGAVLSVLSVASVVGFIFIRKKNKSGKKTYSFSVQQGEKQQIVLTNWLCSDIILENLGYEGNRNERVSYEHK